MEYVLAMWFVFVNFERDEISSKMELLGEKDRYKLFVDIAKPSTNRVQNVADSSLLPQTITWDRGACLSSVSILAIIAH